jgi:hypothetical protein
MSTKYTEYETRFAVMVGAVAVGGYGKYGGQLVRRLSEEEYDRKRAEHDAIERQYRVTVERGDTLNNAVIKVLRELRAELLEPPLPDDLDV